MIAALCLSILLKWMPNEPLIADLVPRKIRVWSIRVSRVSLLEALRELCKVLAHLEVRLEHVCLTSAEVNAAVLA